jgi:hypothetical protein
VAMVAIEDGIEIQLQVGALGGAEEGDEEEAAATEEGRSGNA